ncbi:LPXTG cell wall anchor domain-containing protein [Lysinibacillus macroides]|uniref:LPXTG cell wall anchor domain-containing protein n=1 Tax=Lysinibacillus macroides TaxID=33935 RepID=UPI00193784B7|nr:LPXTG cell wall anchor domain-containing protein [Lysinibacillus macroides]
MKKFNLAIIILLLVFQTILSPLSVLAAEGDPILPVENTDTGDTGSDPGDEAQPTNEAEPAGTETGDSSETEATEPSPPIDEEAGNDSEPVVSDEEGATDTEEGTDAETDEIDEVTPPEEEEQLEDIPADVPMAMPMSLGAPSGLIPTSLKEFELTMNGQKIDSNFSGELQQGVRGRADFEFSANTEMFSGAGSYFTFTLPNSILQLENQSFGQDDVQGNGVRFSYNYNAGSREVTVTLLEDADTEGIGSDIIFGFGFESFFDFSSAGTGLEHDILIPDPGSGSYTVPVIFTPIVSGDPVTKAATTNVVIDASTGDRTIEWEAWINRDGKDLNNAKLIDLMTYNTPEVSGGHELVGNIEITEYEMGLDGPTSAIASNWDEIGFSDISLSGRNAYKLNYTTKVNLPIAEQVGSKVFHNQILLTDENGTELARSTKPNRQTTYGQPLAKSKDATKVNNTYESNWIIDYNFNRATIPQAQAWVEDRFPAVNGVRHLIDKGSIEVYEVEVNELGQFVSMGATPVSNYNLENPQTGDAEEGFRIEFTSNVNKAYRIIYKAEYEKDFYAEQNTTLDNTVVSGTSTLPSVSHPLNEEILTKEATVDFEKKVITWTIQVKADNEAISNLSLTDVFEYDGADGEHTLVEWDTSSAVTPTSSLDAIRIVSGMTGGTKSLTTDNQTGFTITGGNITKGTTAVIKYKTHFKIEADGSVAANGYGNQVTANWSTSEPESYTLTKGDKYEADATDPTTKNGNKKLEKYDYVTQRFDWAIVINTNKVDINGAQLVDTIGKGHELVGDITIHEYTLADPDDDDSGQIGAQLTSGYTIAPPNANNEFTITFDNTFGSPYKTYIVRYQTKDIDNIIGIDDATTANPMYENKAEFTIQGRTTTLGEPTYRIPTGNQLLTKQIQTVGSSTNPYMEWTLDVNKSLSTLGQTKVKDIPGMTTTDDNKGIYVMEGSVRLRPYIVDSNTGITNAASRPYNNAVWQTVENTPGVTIDYLSTGGFELTFDNLDKQGYQVIYRTIAIGAQNDRVDNNATIEFAGSDSLADNQKDNDSTGRGLAYSFSDAHFRAIKGDLSFTKVAVNPLTGEKEPLPGAVFALVKKIGNTDYTIATATSDNDGQFEFKNVNYGTYIVKETSVPVDHRRHGTGEFQIVLSANNDANANESLRYNHEVKNFVTNFDSTGACDRFMITIKDQNGNEIENKVIKLLDSNGNEALTGTTGSSGEIIVKRYGEIGPEPVLEAGEYTVVDENDLPIDVNNPTIIVKYSNGCEVEVQIPNACPTVTVTINDDNSNPRPNVTVTLKDSSNATVATETTDSNGKFTLPTTTPAGTYKVYEGNQYLGTVTIDYTSSTAPCEAELTVARACEIFTLTINDVDGKPRANVAIEIVDKQDPNTKFTGTTNASGVVVFDNLPATGLPPLEYEVFEGGNKIDEFTVDINCEHTVQPAPSCPVFELTIKNEDGPLKAGTKVVIENKDTLDRFEATVTTDGKITFVTNVIGQLYTIDPGNYTVVSYEIEPGRMVSFGEDFTVTYTTDCKAEVEKPRACTEFEITVISPDGATPKANTKVIVEDENGTETEYTTDADGKITLPPTQEPGTVIVYEVNPDNSKGKEIDRVKVTYVDGCQGKAIEKSCPDFRLTINNTNNDPVGANVKVTIKNKAGATVETGVTDANGQIQFVDKAKLEQGEEYDVYNESDVFLGSITVSYIDNVCGAEVQVPANACPQFTLTIQDIYGKNRPGVNFTIKNFNNKTIATGTTNEQGVGIIPYTVEPNMYRVYEGNTLINMIHVRDCAAVAKPDYPSGGGWYPPNPNNPDPNQPVDPNNPDPNKPVDPNNPDPNKPVDPNNPDPNKPVDPNNPDPNKPVDPNNPDPNKPVDPNNPDPNNPADPNNPDPNNPVDPNNPDPNNPADPNNSGSNNPVDPNNPDPNNPADPNNSGSNNSVNSANPTPGSSNPTVSGNGNVAAQDVINQGKQLPSYNPSNATRDTLEAYQNFLNNYNKLSKEEQALVAQAIDIDQIKADAKRLEALLRAQGKLPQTDGANQTALVFVGLLLVIGAVLLMRRRHTES